jgi:cell division protease FtsH
MNGKASRPLKRTPNWTSMIWFGLLMVLLLSFFGRTTSSDVLNISYTDFRKYVSDGQVSKVTFQGEQITGSFKKPVEEGSEKNPVSYKEFKTIMPPIAGSALLDLLEKNGVTVKAEITHGSWFTTFLVGMLPWLLIIGFFVYMRNKGGGMTGGAGGLFGFGKSRAKLYTKSSSNVTFEDVAGLANAKNELSEIVDFLKDPSKYRTLGGKLPKGVLLAGPPGTGKTLMARAVAGEAGVPFYSISGSEFIEMFVGVGASRVRDMFTKAKKDAPAIIFIDEIDSIGRVRGTGLGGGHDEREQTLNQILAEMDGFAPHESVVVMAATNRPDVLDPALVRPGRFDRHITLELPQRKARLEILKSHTRRVPLGGDVDLENVAEGTVGLSGAELKNLVNEAALLAARKDKQQVEAEDFEQARDKILMGIEREDVITDEEKKVISYHEAGHALLAELLPGADPLQKVTIIPRGHSLGATEQIPEEDRHNLKRTYLLDRIAIILGGRAAEKIIFDDISTGAGDDLKKATEIARRMVCQWGMSEKLGPMTFRLGETHPFLGRELTQAKDFSEHTAQLIDEEIHKIVSDMIRKAETLLSENQAKLKALAEELLRHETLTRKEVEKILAKADRPTGRGHANNPKPKKRDINDIAENV